MNYTLSVIGLVLSIMAPISAQAEPSAKEILEAAHHEDRDVIVKTYLAGAMSAYGWVNAEFADRGLPILFCQPQKLAVTADQAISILEKYGERNPELMVHPANYVLRMALADVFPCD